MTIGHRMSGPLPQFILICTSTGGPATYVTWTRNSVTLMNDNTFSLSSVLNDAEGAQYTHSLTVTGRLEGLYTCNVSNDKPSVAVRNLLIEGNIYKHHIIIVLGECKVTKYTLYFMPYTYEPDPCPIGYNIICPFNLSPR